jgi:hypothetical protein
MKFRRLGDLDLTGQRVFIRADLNIPLNDDGAITGTALDAQGNNQAFSARAVTPVVNVSSLSFSSNYFPESATVTATITLGDAAPAGGLTVSLSTNRASLVSFPSTVAVPAGQTTVAFNVTGNAVEANSPFSITAVANGKSASAAGAVRSLTLQNFRLSAYTAKANTALTGSFQLELPALSNGKTIKLWSDNANAAVDSTVTIAAGNQNGTFNIKLGSIDAGTKVTVYAQCGDRTSQTTVSISK